MNKSNTTRPTSDSTRPRQAVHFHRSNQDLLMGVSRISSKNFNY